MEQLGIERLEIDPHIEEKLWVKHGLTFGEVEEALMHDDAIVVEESPGWYNVFGLTESGIPLVVVLVWKGEGLFKVVTAFPMSARQVRWFLENRG